jgi:hypothetical protein
VSELAQHNNRSNKFSVELHGENVDSGRPYEGKGTNTKDIDTDTHLIVYLEHLCKDLVCAKHLVWYRIG